MRRPETRVVDCFALWKVEDEIPKLFSCAVAFSDGDRSTDIRFL